MSASGLTISENKKSKSKLTNTQIKQGKSVFTYQKDSNLTFSRTLNHKQALIYGIPKRSFLLNVINPKNISKNNKNSLLSD